MVNTLKATLQDRRLLFISAAVTLVLAVVGLGVYIFGEDASKNEVDNPGWVMNNRAVTIRTDLSVYGRPATSAHVGDVLRFHMSIDSLPNVSADEMATLGDSINDGKMEPVLMISDCGGNPSPAPNGTAIFDVPTSTPTDAELRMFQWNWTFTCNNTGKKTIEAMLTDPTNNWDNDYQSYTNFAIVEPVEQRVVPILTACSALIAALAGLRGLSLGSKSTEKPSL